MSARRTLPYSVDLVDAYSRPDAPSAESCNAMVVQLCALSEVLGLESPSRPNYVTPRSSEGPDIELLNVPQRGGSLVVGEHLAPQLRAALARPATDARAQLQLALVQCAREVHRGQQPASSGAGAVHLAVILTGVVVAGVVLLYVVQRASALIESDRVRHAAIAAAAAERAHEDDVAARTGTRPPPGPMQQAAAGAITAAASAARADSLGDALRAAGSGLGDAVKWGVGGLVMYALLMRR